MDEDVPSRGLQSTDLKPGTLVNGLYRLVRLLGVGGMGEVWEARHERTKGRVALKLLLPEMGRHEAVLLRFQREVEITSGLNHPNIVRVSDADKLENGRPFLVMEFLEGHDLSYVGRTQQPLGLAETVEIIEQTAMGLQAAHGQSVVHRDLKPANIFVVPLPGTGRVLVKILDFGISKALDGLSQLTQSRNLMGTPHYMAPEQATGGASSVDARADQFSLAAIVYELLTGRMAFAGDGMVNVIFKVVNDTPPSFSSWDIAMPAGVEATVMRGLSKLPAARFGSVLEFSEELRRAAGQVAGERRAHTAILAAAPRTLRFADREQRLTEPFPTTLRASTGQMGVVGSLSGGVAAGSDGEAARAAAKSKTGKTVALILGGTGLAAAILVGVGLKGPPTTSARPVVTEPTVAYKPGSAAPTAVTPGLASAAVGASPAGPGDTPAAAPVVAPVPSAAALAHTEFVVPARQHSNEAEHPTPAVTTPRSKIVEKPSPSSVASVLAPVQKKSSAAPKTLAAGHQTPPHLVKPPATIKKSGGHSGPLNDDL